MAARQSAAWVMALLLVLPLVSTLSEWRLRLDHGPANPAPEMAFIKLEELYREAARRTAPQMSAQTVLAADILWKSIIYFFFRIGGDKNSLKRDGLATCVEYAGR